MLFLKSKSFNIDAIFKLFILLGFTLFFFLTIKTGKVNLFVHPRIIPYMKFAIVGMLVISLFFLADVFKPQRKKVNLLSYLFFLVPLIMAFTLPTTNINSTSMSYSEANPSLKASSNYLAEAEDNEEVNTINDAQNDQAAPIADIQSENKSLELREDTIFMDEDFYKWLVEIYETPSKYTGKKIVVTGFVFKDKMFKANQLVSARLMMTCCAADLSPVGLMGYYDKAAELKQDSWFKFTGKLSIGSYNDQEMPIIQIEQVEEAQKLEEEYVYPY